VEFLHGSHDVGDVFDYVDSLQRVERRIAKRVGKAVDVDDYVGSAPRVSVNAD
jgi:hypothetical protein